MAADESMTNAEWIATLTPERVLHGIALALKARDFEAVEGLLKIMAVIDPETAQVTYDSMLAVTTTKGTDDASR